MHAQLSSGATGFKFERASSDSSGETALVLMLVLCHVISTKNLMNWKDFVHFKVMDEFRPPVKSV